MEKIPEPTRRFEVAELMKQRIAAGNYRYGDRLPSGKELSSQLDASYVTVNRALKLLEDEGYVECRRGVGYFINFRQPEALPEHRIVNLIRPKVAHDRDSISRQPFVELAFELFGAAGWEVRDCPVADNLANGRALINDPETFSLIVGFRPYWRNFTASIEHVRKRVVLLGERSDTDGIACVTSDETQSIRLILDHLAEQGRSRAALVCANLNSSLEMQRQATWRSLTLERGVDFKWTRDYCFDLALPAMSPTEGVIRDLVARLVTPDRIGHFDAVILPDDEMAAHLIGQVMDLGFRVPEDFAVVSIGNTAITRMFRPQISSIDSNPRGHMTIALSILESRAAGHSDNGLYYLCQPQFHPRASSMPVRATKKQPAFSN